MATDPECGPVRPDGGTGTGVNPEGWQFPFVAPGDDVRGLLADLALSIPWAGDRPARRPFRVAALVGFDRAFCYGASSSSSAAVDPAVGVVIVDADGVVAFDSAAAAYSARAWGDRLLIHQWTADDRACRVVQHAGFDPSRPVVVFPAAIAPADGRLDERCVDVAPRRLGTLTVAGAAHAGPLSLACGYNAAVAVTTATAGLRVVNRLRISATPGGGAGTYPACVGAATPGGIASINGVPPDASGDFRLSALDCLSVRQPAAAAGAHASAPTPATLVVGADCVPCLECDDVVAAQGDVRTVYDALVAVYADADAVRTETDDAIARWVAAKACRESKSVTLRLVPHNRQYVEVAVAICNKSDLCLDGIRLQLSFAIDPPRIAFSLVAYSAVIVDGTGDINLYTGPLAIAGDGTFSATWGRVPSRTQVEFKVRVFCDDVVESSSSEGSSSVVVDEVAIPTTLTVTAAAFARVGVLETAMPGVVTKSVLVTE